MTDRGSAPGGAAGGRRVLDRYRLQERVAAGGTAEVWSAVDERLGRTVAVKLLHSHLLPDAGARGRVEAEARAAARLAHSGIVSVYDVSFSPTEAAIVMELVPGESLSGVLEARGPLPPMTAASIAAEIADALAHAHERGILHRDVKPGNVLIAPDGRARIIDFGIARELEENALRLTADGTAVGTLRYMAPEQLAGARTGVRTDVFGLGVTLYELLAGRPPFDATAPAAVIQQQQQQIVPIPGVPTALMGIVAATLAVDPERRPATAAELARMLRTWSSPHAGTATVVVPPPAATAVPPQSPAPLPAPAPAAARADHAALSPAAPVLARASRDAPPRRGGGRRIPALLGALLLGGLLIGAVMALSPGDRGRRNGNGNDPGQVPGKGETASRPFRATEDARIARVGNLLEGAGQSGTLPVGRHRDALYRSLVRFRPDWSGMGEVTRIQLRLRVSGNDRVERGDKPEIRVQRLVSGDWTEGDAVDLSTRNAVTWANQPTATAEDEVTAELPKGGGATVTFDVTELYQPLLPGDRGGEGEPDLGLVLLAKSDDGSSAERKETIEFLSSEASEGGPELLVTYEQP